jgi:hypothetical protein
MGAYVLQLRKALSHSYLRDFTDCVRATATGKQAAVRARAEAVCGDVQTLPGILLSFAIMARYNRNEHDPAPQGRVHRIGGVLTIESSVEGRP